MRGASRVSRPGSVRAGFLIMLVVLSSMLVAGLCAQRAAAAPGDLWVFGVDSPVTADPSHQQHAVVSGDIVLWTDCSPGGEGCRIFRKDLGDKSPPAELVPGVGSQDKAALDGGLVAWEQLVSTPSGGIGYQIHYFGEGGAGPMPLSPAAGRQTNPSVSGSVVVWEDERAGSKQSDIYMFDVASGTEQVVCAESSKQIQPDIEADWVIWVDNRGGTYKYGTPTNNDIYARNLATGEERRVTADTSLTIQSNPAMGRDRQTGDYYAVFEGDGIWLYDFQTRGVRQLAGSGFQPDMSGTVAVWKSAVTGGVMMHDISTGETQAVSTGGAATFNPSISGDRIVWGDERNGSRDIYENRLGDNAWALAERYKPLLHFAHDIYDARRRDFEPRTVELMVDVPGIRLVTADAEIVDPSLEDLASHPQDGNQVDLPGSPANPFNDFSDEYLGLLAASANEYPVTVYGRVLPGGPGSEKTVIQYWLCYYFNDWYNNHEGDWELVQVTLDAQLNPESVAYSQHGDASSKGWGEPGLQTYGDHPRVFVAKGSHANYYRAGGGLRAANAWGRVDRTGEATSHFPDLEMDWAGVADGWVGFAGLWGEGSKWWWPPYTVNEGPRGPAFQGWSWEDPLGWAAASDWKGDLDSAVFSASLSAELHLYDSEGNHVGLNEDGTVDVQIPGAEYFQREGDGTVNIVVRGADTLDALRMSVVPVSPGPVDIRVQVPDRDGAAVYRNEYLSVPLDDGSVALLDTTAGGGMLLSLDTDGDGLSNQDLPADTADVVTVDYVPPGSVTDLAATAISSGSVTLAWTAPGDDDSLGRAERYEVRYSTEPLTEANWDYSREAGSAMSPQQAGSVEQLQVAGLEPGSTYYFAVRARDDAWQSGSPSNVVAATTTMPDLAWSRGHTYWASLMDFQGRRLTVDYELANTGSGEARALAVRASERAPAIVGLVTPMPLPAGDLAPGVKRQVSLKYMVPVGIKVFITRTYVFCRDDSDREYWFPEPLASEQYL